MKMFINLIKEIMKVRYAVPFSKITYKAESEKAESRPEIKSSKYKGDSALHGVERRPTSTSAPARVPAQATGCS